MADIFSIMLGNLARLGFFQYLLPFLLILAIVYGVLRATLKDHFDKSASGLISIIVAFFVMNYSGLVGLQFSMFLTTFLGSGSIVLIGVLVVLILLGMVGIKLTDLFKIEGGKVPSHLWVFLVILILIGVVLFIGSGGGNLLPIPVNLFGIQGQDVVTFVIFIIILFVAMHWLSKGEKEEKAAKG